MVRRQTLSSFEHYFAAVEDYLEFPSEKMAIRLPGVVAFGVVVPRTNLNIETELDVEEA